MSDPSQTALPQGIFNWPVGTRGALASVCLVGLSSSPGSSWLVYPAIAVFFYTVLVSFSVRQLLGSTELRGATMRWALRLIATGFGILVAALFADGPGVFAAIGSLLFILMLAGGSLLTVVLLHSICRAATRRATDASVRGAAYVRLRFRVIWFFISG